jgi:hypothetical protein
VPPSSALTGSLSRKAIVDVAVLSEAALQE